MKNNTEMLTIAALTCILSVSRPTAINLIRTREIQGIRVGGQYRVPRHNLMRYLVEQGLEPELVEQMIDEGGRNAPTSTPSRRNQPHPVVKEVCR